MAICEDAAGTVGQQRIPNAYICRPPVGFDCKEAVVLEPAVFDHHIRICVTASGGPDTNDVVSQFTVVHDQIRSTRGLVDACARAGTGSATIRVTNSTIYHNGSGMVLTGAGAAIESYGNNRVTANTNNSTFSGTVLALQ